MISRRSDLITIVFLLQALLFVACSSGNNDQNVLVTVGEERITGSELFEFLLQHYQSPARVDTLSDTEIAAKLDQLIEDHLILAAARSQGLADDPQLQIEVEEYREKALFDRLIESTVVDSILTNARLREFYDKFGGEIRLQELLIRAPLSKFFRSKADSLLDAKARQTAQSLYHQVVSGQVFTEAVRQFPGEKEKPGQTRVDYNITGYMRWGRLSKEVQDIAFQLEVGEISQPIRTGFGYHIIQLREKKKRPFEAEKETIKQQLTAVYAKTIHSRKENFLRQLEMKYRVKFHNENASRLAEIIGPRYVNSDLLDQNTKQLVLASFSGGEIRVAQLLRKLRNKAQNFRWHERNIQNWTRQATILAIAGLEAKQYEIDVTDEVEVFHDALLVKTMRARTVTDRIRVSEQEMRDYYERHRSELIVPVRVHVREILVQEPYLAQHITRLAKAGEDFSRLADEYTSRIEALGNGGDLGYVSAQVHSDIFAAVKGLEIGAIHGPIQTLKGLSIVQVLDRRIEELPPFEEVKNKIYHLAKQEKLEQKYNDWLGALSAQYPPVFHQNHLSSKYQKISKYSRAVSALN